MKLIVLLLGLLSTSAVQALTITPGNGGGTVDHVRFTAATDAPSASVEGWLNSNPSIRVNFHSSNTLQIDNGEASLTGVENIGFQNLTFSLADGGGFSKAVVKPEA